MNTYLGVSCQMYVLSIELRRRSKHKIIMIMIIIIVFTPSEYDLLVWIRQIFEKDKQYHELETLG